MGTCIRLQTAWLGLEGSGQAPGRTQLPFQITGMNQGKGESLKLANAFLMFKVQFFCVSCLCLRDVLLFCNPVTMCTV